MRNVLLTALASIALAASVVLIAGTLNVQHAAPDLPADQPVARGHLIAEGLSGTGTPDIACHVCHGAGGHGDGISIPSLAGQPQRYLAKQLTDYAGATRAHAVMSPIARSLSQADRDAVAAYYASLPPPEAAGSHGRAGQGASLVMEGDPSRAIPACVLCHARGATGEMAGPPLEGQPRSYIVLQLDMFRDGRRANSPYRYMALLANRLSPDDIAAAADHYGVGPPAGAHQ